ncbi:sulfite exporter TauE/SafE family protein [Halotalea alkalilenta]|uniref:sulfite exporter TauE/SafE family protein n=1 Tax=Halotalea alkalilenta TaxID=376489 RepID=UPI0004893811|nr:sulfite exporter TauE/SafE family protein [Halotalea alkalilenta]
MEFLLYLVLGACSGVLAGLFGVGGGLIIVPVLVYSFAAHGMDANILTHLAVGTSLATIVFTSINSVLGHQKKGAVRWHLVLWMTVGIVFGSVLGGLTASYISGPRLQTIIGVFAICMAIQLAFNLKPKGGDGTFAQPSRLWLNTAGVVIGWASAIFGIGGGSLTVPLLAWKNLPMQQAVATSAACGLPIAIFGALSFMYFGWGESGLPQYSVGFVYLPAVVGIALTSMVFARFGVRLAHRLSQTMLRRLFALLLFCVGLSFVI